MPQNSYLDFDHLDVAAERRAYDPQFMRVAGDEPWPWCLTCRVEMFWRDAWRNWVCPRCGNWI